MAGRISPARPGAGTGVLHHYTILQLMNQWVHDGGSLATAPIAAAIAMAESGGDPNAQGHNSNGTTDYGLWQINSVNGANASYLNPDVNGKAAVRISRGGTNWNPWTTYKNGAYKAFLGNANAQAPRITNPSSGGISIPNPLDTIEGAVGTVGTALSDIAKVISFVFSLQFLYVLFGAGLLMMALYLMASHQGYAPPPGEVAKTAGEAIAAG